MIRRKRKRRRQRWLRRTGYIIPTSSSGVFVSLQAHDSAFLLRRCHKHGYLEDVVHPSFHLSSFPTKTLIPSHLSDSSKASKVGTYVMTMLGRCSHLCLFCPLVDKSPLLWDTGKVWELCSRSQPSPGLPRYPIILFSPEG